MSCCIVQGTEMLSGSMLTQRRKQSLCQTSCLWASSYFSLSSDALLDVFALHLPNQVCCFDPIQDRSRAGRYQVSPDMQHVLFAFEVKLVRKLFISTECLQTSSLSDSGAVCFYLCRSTSIPTWPSTLFTAWWHSKTDLCRATSLLSVVFPSVPLLSQIPEWTIRPQPDLV